MSVRLVVNNTAPASVAPRRGPTPLNPHQAEYYGTPFALLADFPELGFFLALWFWISMRSKRDILIWQNGDTYTGPRTYDDFVMSRMPPGVDPNHRFSSRADLRWCFPFLSWEDSLFCWQRNFTYGRVIGDMVRFEYAITNLTHAASHVGITVHVPPVPAPDFAPKMHPVLDRWGWLGVGAKYTAMIVFVGLAWVLGASVEIMGWIFGASAFLLKIGMWALAISFIGGVIRGR